MVSSELAVKILFSRIVVIVLLQSNIFCALPTDDQNVSDGKEKPTENPILLLEMKYTKK